MFLVTPSKTMITLEESRLDEREGTKQVMVSKLLLHVHACSAWMLQKLKRRREIKQSAEFDEVNSEA
jgi:hypothetical protein